MTLLAFIGLTTASLLLIWSGAVHMFDRGGFHAVLVAHAVLPYRLTGPASRLFPVAELVAGLPGVVLRWLEPQVVAVGARCARALSAASTWS